MKLTVRRKEWGVWRARAYSFSQNSSFVQIMMARGFVYLLSFSFRVICCFLTKIHSFCGKWFFLHLMKWVFSVFLMVTCVCVCVPSRTWIHSPPPLASSVLGLRYYRWTGAIVQQLRESTGFQRISNWFPAPMSGNWQPPITSSSRGSWCLRLLWALALTGPHIDPHTYP